MQEHEMVFRNTYLFSTEELLQSIRLMIEYIKKNDDEDKCSKNCLQNRLKLFNKFESIIEKCKLPTLTKLWWFYEYEFTGKAIELHLCSADSDFEVDEDGYISNLTYSTMDTLLNINCEYLTIEQFADMHGVSPTTVHQWIHCGRLRNAKKNGSNWLIPSTEDKPPRKYESIQYTIENPGTIHINEFPIVSICDSIDIWQDKDKTKFFCLFQNFKMNFNQQMILNRKEVESLEYALISSGKAQPGSGAHYVPMFERNITGK